jgi:hypothetical protein
MYDVTEAHALRLRKTRVSANLGISPADLPSRPRKVAEEWKKEDRGARG